MKVGELLKEWEEALSAMYGDRESENITYEAVEHYINYTRVDVALRKDEPLSDFQLKKMNAALQRLLKGEPVQYVTGEAWFHGLRLKVGPSVLIPRPETSQMVDIIENEWKNCKHLRIIDLCTGSGAIALALCNNLNCDNVTAVEISTDALNVAKENGNLLKLSIDWEPGDILTSEGLPDGKWNIIVSNPPYIPKKERGEVDENVLKFEPSQALFVSDDDPLKYYRAIAEWGGNHLKENGRIYFEINPHFASDLRDLMKSMGYQEIRIERDITGRERFLIAE